MNYFRNGVRNKYMRFRNYEKRWMEKVFLGKKLKKIEKKSWKMKEMLFIVRNKKLSSLHV